MEVPTRRPLRKIAVFSQPLQKCWKDQRVQTFWKPFRKWICPNIIYLYSSVRGGGINVKDFFCVVMSKNGAMRCIINTRYFPECLF